MELRAPDPASADMQGVNKWMEYLCLLSPCPHFNLAFQISKISLLKKLKAATEKWQVWLLPMKLDQDRQRTVSGP